MGDEVEDRGVQGREKTGENERVGEDIGGCVFENVSEGQGACAMIMIASSLIRSGAFSCDERTGTS